MISVIVSEVGLFYLHFASKQTRPEPVQARQLFAEQH